jgi:hypothetical protein
MSRGKCLKVSHSSLGLILCLHREGGFVGGVFVCIWLYFVNKMGAKNHWFWQDHHNNDINSEMNPWKFSLFCASSESCDESDVTSFGLKKQLSWGIFEAPQWPPLENFLIVFHFRSVLIFRYYFLIITTIEFHRR